MDLCNDFLSMSADCCISDRASYIEFPTLQSEWKLSQKQHSRRITAPEFILQLACM